MTVIQRIRRKVANRDYYLSSHAEEEMADDGFEREDVEHAIMNGVIGKRMTEDSRGTRYRIAGRAIDGRAMSVICRFRETGAPIIITVYAQGEDL